jgi:hypothetical protein
VKNGSPWAVLLFFWKQTTRTHSCEISGMKCTVFWDVALCSQLGVDRRFRGSYYLHHQGDECLDNGPASGHISIQTFSLPSL